MGYHEKLLLLAVDAEVVMDGCHRTICGDGEMKVLVYQEVVSRILTDDPEIIHKDLIELAIIEGSLKVILGHANSLTAIAGI
jgi:hypothetical protein